MPQYKPQLPTVRLYAVVALVAAAYTAGHYSLVHGLAYAVAHFWTGPARDIPIFVFQFAAVTLAAQGIDLWLGRRGGVELQYRPGSVYWGAALSAVGALFCAGLLVARRRWASR